MTLEALATKCDVSRSMISLVERGESSPTAVVLEKPAGARMAYETGARDVSIHQQIWVQEGTVEVTLGRDDCLAMQLDEPTAFRNRTRKPARYVVIIASERSRAPGR
jgi:transcriptional regulator with XRE-family HTH domain